jgi:hypothetical protein
MSAISGDDIYVADETYLYLFDKNTGSEKYLVPLPGMPTLVSLIQGRYVDLFFTDEFAIIVSNGKVYCYPRSVLSLSR